MTCLRALILIALFLLSSYAAASPAFKAEAIPPEIKPGDPFIIKISCDSRTDGGSGCAGSAQAGAVLLGKKFPFSPCGEGCFMAVAAAGMGTKPGEYKIKLRLGGKEKSLGIKVGKAAFPTMRLSLPPSKVFLSPEDLERADRERERMLSIFGEVSERLWQGDFVMPLGNKISGAFGTRRIINGVRKSPHMGVDIRGREGEEVRASNTGRVVLAEEFFFGGNTLVIDHGQGIFSVYMHLSRFNAAPGEIVRKGEVLGFVGSTGRSSGPHLHFGVNVLDINANPVSFTRLKM